jgi:hypothetical protein
MALCNDRHCYIAAPNSCSCFNLRRFCKSCRDKNPKLYGVGIHGRHLKLHPTSSHFSHYSVLYPFLIPLLLLYSSAFILSPLFDAISRCRLKPKSQFPFSLPFWRITLYTSPSIPTSDAPFHSTLESRQMCFLQAMFPSTSTREWYYSCRPI